MRPGGALLGLVLAARVAGGAVLSQEVTTQAAASRAAFLGPGLGARTAAMGEARTADGGDPSSAMANPGGLGACGNPGLDATYLLEADGIGIGQVALAIPAGPVVLGGGVTTLLFGAIQRRDESGSLLGEETITDFAVTLGGGVPHRGWFPLEGASGASVVLVKEAAGPVFVAGSAGSVLRLGPAVSAGWVVRHFGPAASGYGPPAVASLGIALTPWPGTQVSGDAGYALASRTPVIAAGAEYRVSPWLALRAGWRHRPAASSPEGLVGLGAGVGVQAGGVRFDYAFQPMGDLALVHRVTVGYRFSAGRRPPEAGESSAGPGPIDPDEAEEFKTAMALYREQRIDEAWRAAYAHLLLHPGHSKAWQLIGNCQVTKGDLSAALVSYREALRLAPDNARLADYIRQLEAAQRKPAPRTRKPAKSKGGSAAP